MAQAGTVLSRWLGRAVYCRAIAPLKGGMINTALRLSFDHAPLSAVVKLNTDPDSAGLRSECVRLEYLRAHTRLPVPEPYLYASADAEIPYSYLLLETMPGVNMTQAELPAEDRAAVERALAEALVELHGHTREMYGRVDEAGVASWADFFVPDLRAMRGQVEGKLSAAVLAEIDAAIARAPDALAEQGPPTLIHSDLWAGNIMVARGEGGWRLAGLVDPSGCKYADVECELAYLQVFDTVGADFFDVYTARRPLRPGYAYRRLFYWLNTYMIHVWLFGDQHYRDRVAEVARAILRGP